MVEKGQRHRFEWGNFLQGGLLLYLMGILFIAFTVQPIVRSWFPPAWVETSAVVIIAEKSAYSGGNGAIHPSYRFEYRYTVDGQTYTGNRYSLKDAGDGANPAVEKFSPNETIAIFYNPNNPALAVVETGTASIFTYFLAFLGIILLVMATGLTFWGSLEAGLLWLFQLPRQPAYRQPMSTVTVSGNRIMANEQVKSMPAELRTTLLAMLRRGETHAAIQHYRQKTKAAPRLAAYVVEQLAAFERRGEWDEP